MSGLDNYAFFYYLETKIRYNTLNSNRRMTIPQFWLFCDQHIDMNCLLIAKLPFPILECYEQNISIKHRQNSTTIPFNVYQQITEII